MTKAWFKDWFDENYILLYKHRDMMDAENQVDLILRVVNPGKTWKILDLCCGEGRHSALLGSRGFNITGVDLSKTLIQSGREKFPELNLIECDMRSIPGRYDLILSLFTSFGYFDDKCEDSKVITEVHNSLNPGGIFWLDFFNSDYIRNNLNGGKTEKVLNGVNVVEERSIVDDRINKKISFQSNSGKREYTESVRLYSKEELECILDELGFRIVNVFGDYMGSEWGKKTERSIFYCRKK